MLEKKKGKSMKTLSNYRSNVVQIQWLRISAFPLSELVPCQEKYCATCSPLLLSDIGFNPKAKTHFHVAFNITIVILCATWHIRDPVLIFLLLLLGSWEHASIWPKHKMNLRFGF